MACRQYLGMVIIDGRYDNYVCAGRPRPEDSPERSWPREHFSWRKWLDAYGRPLYARRVKAAWLDGRSAERAAARRGKSAYVCGFCGCWHIGTLYAEESH